MDKEVPFSPDEFEAIGTWEGLVKACSSSGCGLCDDVYETDSARFREFVGELLCDGFGSFLSCMKDVLLSPDGGCRVLLLSDGHFRVPTLERTFQERKGAVRRWLYENCWYTLPKI